MTTEQILTGLFVVHILLNSFKGHTILGMANGDILIKIVSAFTIQQNEAVLQFCGIMLGERRRERRLSLYYVQTSFIVA
jgi:hypothetical protein